MALETASFIDGLNSSNPAATDALAQADDHLRLIKAAIKANIPESSQELLLLPKLKLTHSLTQFLLRQGLRCFLGSLQPPLVGLRIPPTTMRLFGSCLGRSVVVALMVLVTHSILTSQSQVQPGVLEHSARRQAPQARQRRLLVKYRHTLTTSPRRLRRKTTTTAPVQKDR